MEHFSSLYLYFYGICMVFTYMSHPLTFHNYSHNLSYQICIYLKFFLVWAWVSYLRSLKCIWCTPLSPRFIKLLLFRCSHLLLSSLLVLGPNNCLVMMSSPMFVAGPQISIFFSNMHCPPEVAFFLVHPPRCLQALLTSIYSFLNTNFWFTGAAYEIFSFWFPLMILSITS